MQVFTTVLRGTQIFWYKVLSIMFCNSSFALIYSYRTPKVMSLKRVMMCGTSLMYTCCVMIYTRNFFFSEGCCL